MWALYFTSLFLTCLETAPSNGSGVGQMGGQIPGWAALELGWIPAFPPPIIPWSANWLFLGGWIACLRRRTYGAFVAGLIALALGATTIVMFGPASLRGGYFLW